MPTCSTESCTKPVQGRSLCRSHYSAWQRGQRRYPIKCPECGATATVARRESKYCSTACAAKVGRRAQPIREPKPKPIKTCAECSRQVKSSRKYCSDECVTTANDRNAKAQWSPLRKALEAGDHDGVIRAVRDRCIVTGQGCWEWQGRLRVGYASVRVAGRSLLVHRVVLEAKHQAPLGTQAAHHACANSKCVNPFHLQPVTHGENVAEMLARRSFVTRIRDLEAALAESAPGHHLLTQVQVGGCPLEPLSGQRLA